MRFGICVFPGSNCDYDTLYVLRDLLKQEAHLIYWYEEKDLSQFHCLILPGGFSYGDYLRPGALASKTKLAQRIYNFAEEGGLVLGICNGFQILTELKLLPGALLKNQNLKFICKKVKVVVENEKNPFLNLSRKGEVLTLPIAHGDGRFFVDERTLKDLKEKKLIALRYLENPNGSVEGIAGVLNEKGNVLGLMPHPERASERELSSEDGLIIWQSIINYLKDKSLPF